MLRASSFPRPSYNVGGFVTGHRGTCAPTRDTRGVGEGGLICDLHIHVAAVDFAHQNASVHALTDAVSDTALNSGTQGGEFGGSGNRAGPLVPDGVFAQVGSMLPAD